MKYINLIFILTIGLMLNATTAKAAAGPAAGPAAAAGGAAGAAAGPAAAAEPD